MCTYKQNEQQSALCATEHTRNNNFLHDHQGHEHHDHSLADELIMHFPLSVFAVSVSLIILSIMTALCAGFSPAVISSAFHQLFHSFHYLHIVFACIGTVLTFLNFSSALVPAVIVGLVSPAVFCVLSDVIMPYVAGELLGIKMQLHVCFFSEYFNITAFLLIGLLTGFFLRAQITRGMETRSFLRVIHFSHILLSALSSLFYMVSHGYTEWTSQMGVVFIIMIICVVVPCTMSDVVTPITIARLGKK